MSNRLLGTLCALATILIVATVYCLPPRLPTTPWLTDLPKAQAQAKAEHKMVFMDFTGSDWCPGCQLLHKKVLITEAFDDYAKSNLVCVIVDFPEVKPQTDDLKKTNKALSDKFKVDGFPVLIVLDGDGKELNREIGYGGETPKEFIANLEKIRLANVAH